MATKPSLSIFTGDKNLGRVFREQNQIVVPFFELNMPLSDTTGKIAINTSGKTRIIMIQGAHDGTGFDGATSEQKLSDFIYEMEEWINASIQVHKVYTDSLNVAYNVYCVDWTWTRSFNDPFRVLWSLMLKQA